MKRHHILSIGILLALAVSNTAFAQDDDEVVYAEFDDGTGILLGRMDGDWGEYLPKLDSDKITDSGVRLAKHKHSGVESGGSNTGNPV